MGRVLLSLSKAYGNHPIAWEIAGDHSLLETIDTGFLKRWHQTFYRPYNMAFSVAGDFEVRSLLSACETALRQYALPLSPQWDGTGNTFIRMPALSGSHRKMGQVRTANPQRAGFHSPSRFVNRRREAQRGA